MAGTDLGLKHQVMLKGPGVAPLVLCAKARLRLASWRPCVAGMRV